MPAAPDTARAIAVADQAAEALRTLNHLTRHAGILTDPAGAYHLLAALTSLADRLPQLLDQISTRLHTDLPARLRIDALAPNTDPAALLAGVAADLARAGHHAHRLGTSLDQAQQLLSHLAADDTDQPDEKYEMTEQGVSFRPPPGGQFSAAVDTQRRKERSGLTSCCANCAPRACRRHAVSMRWGSRTWRSSSRDWRRTGGVGADHVSGAPSKVIWKSQPNITAT